MKKQKDYAMKFSIIDPYQSLHFDISWLEINTPVGNMVILPEHAPMIIELSPAQELSFELIDGKKETVFVSHGFCHVTRHAIKIFMSKT